MLSIQINTYSIRRTDDGLISLTDLYAAALSQGQADSKLDPRANGIASSRKVSLRDLMSIEQLTATAMAELAAAKQITKFNAHGNARCESECDRAARNVAALLQ